MLADGFQIRHILENQSTPTFLRRPCDLLLSNPVSVLPLRPWLTLPWGRLLRKVLWVGEGNMLTASYPSGLEGAQNGRDC
jgi:hypothetical protein